MGKKTAEITATTKQVVEGETDADGTLKSVGTTVVTTVVKETREGQNPTSTSTKKTLYYVDGKLVKTVDGEPDPEIVKQLKESRGMTSSSSSPAPAPPSPGPANQDQRKNQ